MNIIRKMIIFIKNIFVKEEKVKRLEEPKVINQKDERDNFIKSLKVNIAEKRKNKRVETLICVGDGLGIQKKISS